MNFHEPTRRNQMINEILDSDMELDLEDDDDTTSVTASVSSSHHRDQECCVCSTDDVDGKTPAKLAAAKTTWTKSTSETSAPTAKESTTPGGGSFSKNNKSPLPSSKNQEKKDGYKPLQSPLNSSKGKATGCYNKYDNEEDSSSSDGGESSPGAFCIAGSSCHSTVAECHHHVIDSDSEEDDEDSPPVILEATLVVTELKKIQICMAICDGCKGWDACKHMILDDATFSCQADTLSHITTAQEYADFFEGFGKACPNASWTTHAAYWCSQTNTATLVCTYHCTHSQSNPPYGPVEPTNKTAHSDYIYFVTTDPDRDHQITHIKKVWNDKWCLRDLGWIVDEDDEQEEDEEEQLEEEDLLGGSLRYRNSVEC